MSTSDYINKFKQAIMNRFREVNADKGHILPQAWLKPYLSENLKHKAFFEPAMQQLQAENLIEYQQTKGNYQIKLTQQGEDYLYPNFKISDAKQKIRNDIFAKFKANQDKTITEQWLSTQRIENFQSSRANNINTLFFQTIGLKELFASWQWQGMNNKQAITCLNTLLDLRGDYVHRNSSYRLLGENDLEYFPIFIKVLANISANQVRDYIYEQVGDYPWLYNDIFSKDLNFDSIRCTER